MSIHAEIISTRSSENPNYGKSKFEVEYPIVQMLEAMSLLHKCFDDIKKLENIQKQDENDSVASNYAQEQDNYQHQVQDQDQDQEPDQEKVQNVQELIVVPKQKTRKRKHIRSLPPRNPPGTGPKVQGARCKGGNGCILSGAFYGISADGNSNTSRFCRNCANKTGIVMKTHKQWKDINASNSRCAGAGAGSGSVSL